jgi:hypothetical protein
VVQEFVAKDHLARFVLNLVRDDIDLIEITSSYAGERGQPPFDPVMMTALLLYSYCSGIYSSRRIAKACRERVILHLCETAGLVKLGHVAPDGTKIKANALNGSLEAGRIAGTTFRARDFGGNLPH